MPPASPREPSPIAASPSSGSIGGGAPKRPSLQRRDSFVRSPRFSSRRLTGVGVAGRSPSLLAMGLPDGDDASSGGSGGGGGGGLGGSPGGALGSSGGLLNTSSGSAAKAARRGSSMFVARPPMMLTRANLSMASGIIGVGGLAGGGGPARDYRETYQHLLNKVESDTKDLEWDLLEHKTRMIEPIPKERKVANSFMIYHHLRPIPRSVCDEPEGASLDIVHGPPAVWKVGHPMTPCVKVQLISQEDQPIAAWKANIEVKAVLLNGTGDWLLERGDGRSIILGNVAYLDGWEAEFPELRVMDTSAHYKRSQYRLLFVVNNYRVAPVITEPFVIEPEACPKSEQYLYEAEEEEEVDFAVPADKNPDAAHGVEASPLHVAAAMGQSELCKLLVAKGDDLNQLAQHGISPLHLLSYLGFTELARTFIECGAEVNTAADSGMTALHYALVGGQYQTAQALLAEPELDPRAITTRGWGCMHLAARAAPPPAIRALARAGGDIDLRNRDGQTPLHIATFHGNIAAMRELQRSGADPMTTAKGGWSLPHQAVLGGSPEALEVWWWIAFFFLWIFVYFFFVDFFFFFFLNSNNFRIHFLFFLSTSNPSWSTGGV
jgi:ankyrin repeat protein